MTGFVVILVVLLGAILSPPAASSERTLTGYATWDAGQRSTHDAAAGPALRAKLGANWRGKIVTVHHAGRSLRVRLSDWCACGPRHGQPTLIDLDDSGFALLAPRSEGVIAVSVEVGSSAPRATLPPTDTAP